jgi:hypothetical protein
VLESSGSGWATVGEWWKGRMTVFDSAQSRLHRGNSITYVDLRDGIRDAAADATSDVASAAGHFRQET